MSFWFGCSHKRLGPPRNLHAAVAGEGSKLNYVATCIDCHKVVAYKLSTQEKMALDALARQSDSSDEATSPEETTHFWGVSGKRLLQLERLEKKPKKDRLSPHSPNNLRNSESKRQSDRMSLASRHRLAVLHHNRGNLSEAESLYREVILELECAADGSEVDLEQVLNNLATLLAQDKRHSEAVRTYRKSISEIILQHGDTSPRLVRRMLSLGELQLAMGDVREAQMTFMRALSLAEKVLPRDHPDSVRILREYAKALRMGNRSHNASEIEARLASVLSSFEANS